MTTMAKKLGAYPAKQCLHRAHLDVVGDPDLMVEPDAAQQHIFDEGNAHEERVGKVLAQMLGPRIRVLKADKIVDGRRDSNAKKRRETATRKAMAEGVDAIWNGRLVIGGRKRGCTDDTSGLLGRIVAEPDLLIGGPKLPNGKRAYYPVDVKHHQALTGTRTAGPWLVSELHAPAFEQAIAKDRGDGAPHLGDAMQLAHYHRGLQAVGHAGDDTTVIGGVIGKQLEIVWFDITDKLWRVEDPELGKRTDRSALDVYDEKFAAVVDVVDNAQRMLEDDDVAPITSPMWKAECAGCPWREACHDELKANDHVSLLQGVTVSIAKVHEAVGITTRRAVSHLDRNTALLVDHEVNVPAAMVKASTLDPRTPVSELITGRYKRQQAEGYEAAGITTVGQVTELDPVTAGYATHKRGVLRLADTIDMARVSWMDRVHRRRGITELNIPRGDIEVDIDMENDPSSDIIYMWGTTTTVRDGCGIQLGGRHNRYHADHGINWSGDEDFDPMAAEAQACADMWEWISTLRSLARLSDVTLRLYCFSGAEERCLRAIARKHRDYPGVPTEADIDELVQDEELWVDMLKVISAQMIWPTPSMSIKDLAKYAKFAWRDTDASGGNSIVWYNEAVGDPDPAVRVEAFRRILVYNEDDTRAMAYLRDWITERLMAASNVTKKVPCVDVYDSNGRFHSRRRRSRAKASA